jgi:hypothetical protein
MCWLLLPLPPAGEGVRNAPTGDVTAVLVRDESTADGCRHRLGAV